MPLSPEQEAICERLEKGESTPSAASLIRKQAHEISVIECFETDGGVNYRSDRLILF
jgi:hypothetical protein